MAVEICPVCGCTIAEGVYELGDIKYCCEPCATGGQCDCGCCEIVVDEEE